VVGVRHGLAEHVARVAAGELHESSPAATGEVDAPTAASMSSSGQITGRGETGDSREL
jgi:hypothetical protein